MLMTFSVHSAKIARRIEIAKPKKRIFKKMLSLDDCGIEKECLTLPRPKPVPIQNKGFCSNSRKASLKCEYKTGTLFR